MSRKILYAIFLTLFCSLSLNAQEGVVMTEIRAGDSAANGGFAAVSLNATYDMKQYFSIGGGAQYSTIGKIATEICPSYFHDFPWGRIYAEALLHYSKMRNTDNIAAGAGVALSSRWIHCRAGYYFRTFGLGDRLINEPFNLYYKFAVNCLPMLPKWDLQLYMTNCETFELERHYYPSFVAQCWYYPSGKIGVTLGACYKPAGMFHLTSDYYQIYTKAGICYRW